MGVVERLRSGAGRQTAVAVVEVLCSLEAVVGVVAPYHLEEEVAVLSYRVEVVASSHLAVVEEAPNWVGEMEEQCGLVEAAEASGPLAVEEQQHHVEGCWHYFWHCAASMRCHSCGLWAMRSYPS